MEIENDENIQKFLLKESNNMAKRFNLSKEELIPWVKIIALGVVDLFVKGVLQRCKKIL